MGKWKISLGVLIGVLVIALAVFSLNHKPTQKVPVDTANQMSPSSSPQLKIVDPNAAKFEGQDNLTKYEGIAQKNLSSPSDQANAATSAYANGDYNKAIEYYKKAVALQPKNAQYTTSLGNVYFRGLKNSQEAKKYYLAATQDDPRYAFGWLNLALCDIALANNEEAKVTLQKGIASVDPKDPVLKELQQQLSKLK